MAFKRKKEGSEEKEMSFLEHLEELRWHIIRSILAIIILMIVAFVFKNIIFDVVILAPKSPEFFTNRMLCQLGELLNTTLLCINTRPLDLINIKMSGQLTTHIAVSLVAGLILAFPVVIWEFWKFFKPALHTNEAHHARGAVLVSSLLFFTGVLFGYFMLVPLSIHFLGSYQISATVANQIYVRSYIGTISSICLATGLIFELPIITFFLTKVGIVTPRFLIRYRKHAIVLIVVLSAIITPPDIFSQLLVSLPLFFLYQIGISISKRVMKKKEKEREEFMKGDSSAQSDKTRS